MSQERKVLITWNKIHFSSFLNRFYWSKWKNKKISNKQTALEGDSPNLRVIKENAFPELTQ